MPGLVIFVVSMSSMSILLFVYVNYNYLLFSDVFILVHVHCMSSYYVNVSFLAFRIAYWNNMTILSTKFSHEFQWRYCALIL